ncbi:hypothetical protein SteCoe_9372 [Stentor coeruleus]|uniref:Uncharacterized protein n=1 Tax=Stentor coeruleus TaxID=5963 RepID=A0A1R2CI08_9CILI|nr:hypothetical protein SteCoe_9372 [Stentor coeruleus]
MKNKPITMRFVLLGSSNVGKTSICSQYVSHSFSKIYTPTSEITTFRTLVEINKLIVLLQIDDLFPINHPSLLDPREENSENKILFEKIVENKKTHEIQRNINPIYTEKAIDGIIFVFDLTSKESFDYVEKIISFITSKEQERLNERHPRLTKKVLLGNKFDLHKPAITSADIERIKISFNLTYFKTSTKDNRNINESLHFLTETVLNDKKLTQSTNSNTSFDSEFGLQPSRFSWLTWCDCSRRHKSTQCEIF